MTKDLSHPRMKPQLGLRKKQLSRYHELSGYIKVSKHLLRSQTILPFKTPTNLRVPIYQATATSPPAHSPPAPLLSRPIPGPRSLPITCLDPDAELQVLRHRTQVKMTRSKMDKAAVERIRRTRGEDVSRLHVEGSPPRLTTPGRVLQAG